MKKETLINVILSTIGGILLAIGMCMCLITEWNLMTPGIIMGIVGIIVLLCIYPIYRKNHPKEKKNVNSKFIVLILVGILGALLLGWGMSMCLVEENSNMFLGIIVGIMGLVISTLNYPIYKFKNNSI